MIENYLRLYVQTTPAVSRLRRGKDLDVLDRDLFDPLNVFVWNSAAHPYDKMAQTALGST